VKVFGPSSADLRLELRNEGGRAMIGGALRGEAAELSAKVLGGDGRTLQVLRDGRVVATTRIGGDDFDHTVNVEGKGDYRLQVMRGPAVDALTTPVTLGRAPEPEARPGQRPGAGAGAGAPAARSRRLRVTVTPRRVRAGRRVRLRVRVRRGGRPVRGMRVRAAGRRTRTGRRGRATLRVRFNRTGRHRVRVGPRTVRIRAT
jgi:hypothetical protein